MKFFCKILTIFITLPLFTAVGTVSGQATPMNPASSPTNAFSNFSVTSPLKTSITDVPGLILAILNMLITISVPIIVIAIVYSGFSYVTSQGNPEKIKTATRTLTYAVIGAILIIGALVITDIIGSTVQSFSTP